MVHDFEHVFHLYITRLIIVVYLIYSWTAPPPLPLTMGIQKTTSGTSLLMSANLQCVVIFQ